MPSVATICGFKVGRRVWESVPYRLASLEVRVYSLLCGTYSHIRSAQNGIYNILIVSDYSRFLSRPFSLCSQHLTSPPSLFLVTMIKVIYATVIEDTDMSYFKLLF